MARVNYVDVRGINNNSYDNFYDYIINIYIMNWHHIEYIAKLDEYYNKDEITLLYFFQLKKEKIEETFEKLKNIIELNDKIYKLFSYLKTDKVESFWVDLLYNNEYVEHELKKITDEKLREKITDFFEDNIRTFVYSNKQKWIDNIPIILDPKTIMSDYLTSVKIVFDPCNILLARIVDMYTICRMFKDFDIEKTPYDGADYKDQPKRANNIIIYTGDEHSTFYRKFLDKMQFEKISAKSQSQTCIDLRNFPLPFFSMSAINNYYIGKDEDEIIVKLDEEGQHLMNLSHTDSIDQEDAFEQLDKLLVKYIFYIENFKIRGFINRCGVITGPWQMGKVDQGVIVFWMANHIYNEFKPLLKKNVKKIIMPYEGQPFQNLIIKQSEKFNKNIKTIGFVHNFPPALPTNLIRRIGSPKKIIVCGTDQKYCLNKYLSWPKKDILISKSSRFINKNKDMSEIIFLPGYINSVNFIVKNLKKLILLHNYSNIRNFKIKIHPHKINSKIHIYVKKKISELFKRTKDNNYNKEKISIFFGSTGSIVEALECGCSAIHIVDDPALQIYGKNLFPNINIETIDKNIYIYSLKKKNMLLNFGKKKVTFNNYLKK